MDSKYKDSLPAADEESALPAPGQETAKSNEPELALDPADDNNQASTEASNASATSTQASAQSKDDQQVTLPQGENLEPPMRKSGMAWLWWILAGVFVAIIILCCVRSYSGNKQCKSAACTTTTSAQVNAKTASAPALKLTSNDTK